MNMQYANALHPASSGILILNMILALILTVVAVLLIIRLFRAMRHIEEIKKQYGTHGKNDGRASPGSDARTFHACDRKKDDGCHQKNDFP